MACMSEDIVTIIACYLSVGLFIGLCCSSSVNRRITRSIFWWAKYWLLVATMWPMFLFVWGNGRR